MTRATSTETETEQQSNEQQTVQTRLADFIEDERLCTDGGQPIEDPSDDEEATGLDDETEITSVNTRQITNQTPPETLTPSVKQFIYLDRGNECEVCGADGDDTDVELQIHHRQHQANGGRHHPENVMLLCERCHDRHHGNTPAPRQPTEGADNESSDGNTDASDPLPPRSKPNQNGTDSDVLAVIEEQGPVRTADIAAQIGHTKQTVRRLCWKLSGEQLIARTADREWDLREQVGADNIVIGLPDSPKKARRAGRDEVIRKMSAHNIPHTEIAEITGLTRQTVSVAVDRARALRVGTDADPVDVGYATIAQRLTALVDLLDHAHSQATDS